MARPAAVAESGAALGGADDAANEVNDPEAVRARMVGYVGLLLCGLGLGLALLV